MGYSFRSYHQGTTWDGGGVISCIWPVSGVFLWSMACVQAGGLCVEQFRKSGGLHAVARRSAAYLHSLLSSARAWNRLEMPVSRSFFRYCFHHVKTRQNVGRLQDGSDWASMFPWTSLFPWPPGFVSRLLGYIHISATFTAARLAALQTLFRVLQDC